MQKKIQHREKQTDAYKIELCLPSRSVHGFRLAAIWIPRQLRVSKREGKTEIWGFEYYPENPNCDRSKGQIGDYRALIYIWVSIDLLPNWVRDSPVFWAFNRPNWSNLQIWGLAWAKILGFRPAHSNFSHGSCVSLLYTSLWIFIILLVLELKTFSNWITSLTS